MLKQKCRVNSSVSIIDRLGFRKAAFYQLSFLKEKTGILTRNNDLCTMPVCWQDAVSRRGRRGGTIFSCFDSDNKLIDG
ncbi:MAG: hypothetical protein D3909_19820 [Candidatus Electrothrix sp. ATG1]|nr:hypothetical protein [Candidatus Electrothrix sp. ATG1]